MTDLPSGSFQPQQCSPNLGNMLKRGKFSKEINFRGKHAEHRYYDSTQFHHPSAESRADPRGPTGPRPEGSGLCHHQHPRLPQSSDTRPVPQALSRRLSPPGHQLPAEGAGFVSCHTPRGPGCQQRWAVSQPHGRLQHVLEVRILTIISSPLYFSNKCFFP